MAYFISSGKRGVTLPYLPIQSRLKSGRLVSVHYYDAELHEKAVYEMLRDAVEDGQSYPQQDMSTLEQFRAFYTTHETFVLKDDLSGDIIGSFYVKPNFPGRCSHVCNGGFLVHKAARKEGAGTLMVEIYLVIARDLNYKCSLFNLVFVTNLASVQICRSLGFREVGRIPNVADLKGFGFTDGFMFYRDFSDLPKGIPDKWKSLNENY